MSFELGLRVYYEDTDAGGIVYYANYLKFMERARTEALLALGMSQTAVRERLRVVFAVRSVSVDYLAPARLEDQLVVTAAVVAIGGPRIEIRQEVRRGEAVLVKARVVLVCIATEGRAAGRATRIPEEVRRVLAGLMEPEGRP